MDTVYDIVIIGGGPAGLTAGIYAARARMKVLLLEKMMCGGQILTAHLIENYPGFPCGTTGPELADLILKQAKAAGLIISTREVKKVSLKKKDKDPFIIEAMEGDIIKSLSIIIATGAKWSSLNVPGEDNLRGRGVSYCATCDGPLFKGREVIVVGGGDTAVGEAIYLTRFAEKVTIVHRRAKLRATPIIQERALANKKISFCLKSEVIQIMGENKVEGVRVKNTETSETSVIKSDGVFVLIGLSPNSDIFKGTLKTDAAGYIISDEEMKTSLEGVFVCGDVRHKPLKQVANAVGDGAVAAVSAGHYVDDLKGNAYR